MLIILFVAAFLRFFGKPPACKRIKSTIFVRSKKQRFGHNITKLIEMFRTLLFTLLIIAICVALLAVKVIFLKNGRFPNTHVSGNKAMRKRGIKCAQSQDRDARRENPMAVKEIL